MKLLTCGLVAGCFALAPFAQAQNSSQECRDRVADALNVSGASVDASRGGTGENGNLVVDWEANLGGRRIRGFCETNRNGRVISAQLGRSFGGGNNGGGRGDNDNFPGKGRGNNGGGNNGGAIFSVNLDTSGRGTLTGMGQNVRITRGWVDTRTTPSVSLSGEGDFKITFTGSVVGSGQDREFTIRISGSSRGNASGTATVRLNPARDEVESIRVEGRVGNGQVTGTFNRD